MKNCIFCKIIKGEVDCYKIYEDDFCIAFLDISKDVYGHTLVVPKKHVENVATCDNGVLAKLIQACKIVGNHYVEDCGFDGYNILNACGEAAGQSVFHLHFHVIPRKSDDGENAFPKFSGCKSSLEDVCKKLKFKEKKVKSLGKQTVALYTDGACSGNPGPGGWACIMSYGGVEKILSGGEKETTNNRMELLAVINGIENIKEGTKIQVYSDSAYVVNAFLQDWIGKWLKQHWRNSDGKPVANMELWKRLLKAIEGRNVTFNKVKGHSDDINNNRCDELARAEIAKFAEELEAERLLKEQENSENEEE